MSVLQKLEEFKASVMKGIEELAAEVAKVPPDVARAVEEIPTIVEKVAAAVKHAPCFLAGCKICNPTPAAPPSS